MLTHIDDRNKHSCSSPIDERALLFLAKSLVDLKGTMRILTFQSLLGIFYLFPSFVNSADCGSAPVGICGGKSHD